ncbi:TIGR00159 family protein [Candidatus Berkelbacteria bacterium]|nr:TIGR00159 family protein [Candidatus Berkelbacteria bacterium]
MSSHQVLAGLQAQVDALAGAFQPIGWTDFLDVLLVAAIFYAVYILIRETRALRILYGILFLVLVYVVAQLMNLTALTFLLSSVFTVTLVAIPIVFQPELRAALERIGRGELVSTVLHRNDNPADETIDHLVRVVGLLTERRVGALMVIERETGLKDLASSGVPLNAILTPETLLTIFTPRTPLHDGAVIIRDNRIVAASVFLPLSDDTHDISLGTRHRAAIGVTRDSDAVVIVVSEESGRVSVAHRGKLEQLPPAKLGRRLEQLLRKRNGS